MSRGGSFESKSRDSGAVAGGQTSGHPLRRTIADTQSAGALSLMSRVRYLGLADRDHIVSLQNVLVIKHQDEIEIHSLPTLVPVRRYEILAVAGADEAISKHAPVLKRSAWRGTEACYHFLLGNLAAIEKLKKITLVVRRIPGRRGGARYNDYEERETAALQT